MLRSDNENWRVCATLQDDSVALQIGKPSWWINLSHSVNKLKFDKVWKFELESALGAQWTHSPHLGALCSGCSRQNRGPVSSPQQSQQRISAFLSQRFPCINNSTHSATQSLTNDKQRDSCAQLWSLEKKPDLNVVSDAWYFLIPVRAREEIAHQMGSSPFLSCLA